MLYYHKKGSLLPTLEPLTGLKITECDDPQLLSVLGSITLVEAMRRLANDHKAFVAWYNDRAAAFGWMACGKAKVGELNHEIILPLDHRYMWNFRTLQEFRGLGIYPRLLQYILKEESNQAECFWIMHAPENRASEKGILKAGFHLTGSVSVVNGDSVVFTSAKSHPKDIEEAIESLGFSSPTQEPATCWTCSSPYLAHRKTDCCCVADHVAVCNGSLFQVKQDSILLIN